MSQSSTPDTVVVVPGDGSHGCALCGAHPDGHHSTLARSLCQRCAEWVTVPSPTASPDTVFVGADAPWPFEESVVCPCDHELPAIAVAVLVSAGFTVRCDRCSRRQLAVLGEDGGGGR